MNRILVCGLLAGLTGWAVSGGAADGRGARGGSQPAGAAAQPVWLAPIPVRPVHTTSCYPRTTARAADGPDAVPRVWVVDGAGDLRGCSTALKLTNPMGGGRVEFTIFPWSHGYRQLYRDQTDMDHAREQGQKLATTILGWRAREPGRRVVVIAHSAGSAVALAAADSLPTGSVDRIVLLAPSVSTAYDVRPALWAAREGMDVFCSKKDWVALGFVTRVVGTVDRYGAKAAGRHGFQPGALLTDAETVRLRQHFWGPEVAWTGHTGGHQGTLSPAFLQTYVFPLLGAADGDRPASRRG